MSNSEVVKPTLPTLEQKEAIKDWLKYGRGIYQNSPSVCDDISKILITVSASLASLYSGGVTLLEILKKDVAPLWMTALPVVFWMLTVYLFIRAVRPERYRTIEDLENVGQIQDFVERASEVKYRRQRLGLWFLSISLVLSLGILLGGSYFASQPRALPQVQVSLSASSLGLVQNMGVSIDRNGLTDLLSLKEETDSTYKLILPSGAMIEFSKDIVNALVYKK